MRNNKRSTVVFAKKPTLVATQVALAVMAQLAYAQQPVQTAERVERVEITGTRLPTLEVEGPSPVTVMSAQEIKMDGLAKTEDLLNNLPQVYAAQGSNASNGATGTANINLRNLGPTRNLILLNGRRLPAGSPRSGASSAAVDVNAIPAPLIQRVELLTGGASAVYGSDAISGVVNFIMNDRFEGLQFDLYHSFYNHQQQNPNGIGDLVASRGLTNPAQFKRPDDVGSDGMVNGVSMLMGKNFADNKGNATVFLSYRKEKEVKQDSRDFSDCALNGGQTFQTGGCGGSSTSYPGRFFLTGAAGPATGGSRTIADAAGNTRAFAAATDQFNFNPYNYYRRPSEQTAMSAFAHYDLSPQARAYAEIGMHDNHTEAQIAPSGSFGLQEQIFFENPFLSADWKARLAAQNAVCAGSAICRASGASFGAFAAPGDQATVVIARRNVEGGGRLDDLRHTSYRGVFGFKGDLSPEWKYDVFVQQGKVIYQDVVRNYFANDRINKALDAVIDPATGLPACRSAVAGTDPNCVPYNIWQLNQVSNGALNYLQQPGLQNGRTEQDVFGGSLTADLSSVKLPTAREGLALLVGLERRRERLKLDTDTNFQTANLAGGGGETFPVDGKLGVDEWYTEARLPLAQRKPFADQLSISGSFRHSSYTTNQNTNTYGVGSEWAPVKNYRFRGSYQYAVRHANIQELYQPQGNNLFGMNGDPCGAAKTATLGQCVGSGLNPALYGNALLDSPAGQFNFLQGGNLQLAPEVAYTYTIGLVMTPFRNMTATIDWWNIRIHDAIGNAPPSTLLQSCLNTGNFCNTVHRDASGTLWLNPAGRIDALNANLGGYETAGVDFAANYTWRMGSLGGFGINWVGTYVSRWDFEPIKGGGTISCAGYYGPQCGTPNPEWRHKVRGTWATPWNVDMALTWRHIDKVVHEAEQSNSLTNGAINPTDKVLGSRDYIDIAANWTISKTFSLRAGINNLFDKDPPIVSNVVADPSIFGNGNTFPQIYDTLGRLVFMNLTMKF